MIRGKNHLGGGSNLGSQGGNSSLLGPERSFLVVRIAVCDCALFARATEWPCGCGHILEKQSQFTRGLGEHNILYNKDLWKAHPINGAKKQSQFKANFKIAVVWSCRARLFARAGHNALKICPVVVDCLIVWK